ncbi:hypothetical protein J6590_068847 [Homalodisca vitripennis]|nr:hypothetical protein J6590_068847 [Homalodisca vitripennis]
MSKEGNVEEGNLIGFPVEEATETGLTCQISKKNNFPVVDFSVYNLMASEEPGTCF